MVCSLSVSAFAAPVDEATIDMSRTGNIDLWKYDLTNDRKGRPLGQLLCLHRRPRW
jgi:hypothetical protein